MKLYSNEKQRELWNKDKANGKRKFVVNTTLAFISCMLFTAIVPYLLSNYIFGITNYSLKEIVLFLAIYIMAMIAIGIKMSNKIWVKRTIKFDGIVGILTEVQDNELRNLILKGEKIMAAKRYRVITGNGLKEAISYVDLISEHYSNIGQQ